MADSSTGAPMKKKLPFKRTVARRKSPGSTINNTTKSQTEDDHDDGVDLFRHVHEELPQVLQEQERRMREKEKRSSSSAARKGEPDDQDVKRRKLSIDRYAYEDSNGPPGRGSPQRSASKPKVGMPSLFDDGRLEDVQGKDKGVLGPNELSKRHANRSSSPAAIKIDVNEDDDDDHDFKVISSPKTPRSGSNAGRRTRSQRLIDLDGEEGSSENPFASSPPTVRAVPDDDDDNDSDDIEILAGPPAADDDPDDEFREYIQRARERAEREAKLKLERESQALDSQETKSSGDGSFGAQDDVKAGSQDHVEDDPVIKILVTSEIPHTDEKMFERRMNAPLGPVRDFWLGNQNPPVPKEQWHLCFLTWKGNRIYSTTTCANLGIRIGRVEDRKGNRGKLGSLAGAEFANKEHGTGLHQGGLLLEAWTEDLYDDYLKRKERQRLRLLGHLDDDDGDGTADPGGQGSEGPGGGAEEEATTRVILKAAKDYEPLRFKVHGNTTIDNMIATFRDKRDVPADREISLFFDGEKLDGDTAVKDTEIEDMDSLEVHIK